MLKRGYKHNSPLDVNGHSNIEGEVDRKKARRDLAERCEDCRITVNEEKVNK